MSLLNKLNNMSNAELSRDRLVIAVDDNQDQAEIVAQLLGMMGFNAKFVFSLEDARKMIAAEAAAGREMGAIITDDGLLKEKGRHFYLAAKKDEVPGLSANTPVLVLSGSTDMRGKEGESDEHILAKPAEIDVVVNRLRSLLIQARAKEEMPAISQEEVKAGLPERSEAEIAHQWKSLREALKVERKLASRRKDWGTKALAYIDSDQEYLEDARDRAHHREQISRIKGEMLNWVERYKKKGEKKDASEDLLPH